jgi:hypothetical protein
MLRKWRKNKMNNYACWTVPCQYKDGHYEYDWGKLHCYDESEEDYLSFALVNAKSTVEAQRKYFFQVYCKDQRFELMLYFPSILQEILEMPLSGFNVKGLNQYYKYFSVFIEPSEAHKIMDIANYWCDTIPDVDKRKETINKLNDVCPYELKKTNYPWDKLEKLSQDTLYELCFLRCRDYIAVAPITQTIT